MSMCGRYSLVAEDAGQLRWLFHIEPPPNWQSRYNIAPSQYCPVVRRGEGGRELVHMRWGLIPSWAKEAKVGFSNINARAESVATKPAFRAAFKRRRCVVPATGFYEWKAVAGQRKKQPYHVQLPAGAMFGFAGLWEHWQDIESFAIVTTDATPQLQPIHERMPVILTSDAIDRWLDADATREDLQALLQPYPGAMDVYPVSTAVNKPVNDAPECVQPVSQTPSLPGLGPP